MLPTTPTPQTRASRACARGAKTRVWGFCKKPPTRAGKNPAQTAKPHRVAKSPPSKTASGMRYYGFRYYNPTTGRWLSRDPIGEKGGLNLYGMVRNNPLSFVDILGLACCDTKTVDEGEKWLNDQFKLASAKAKTLKLTPALPGGIPSCKGSSNDVLHWLRPSPKCWTCRTELRREHPVGHKDNSDHQVVICTGTDDAGKTKEIVFDWWGDNLWWWSGTNSGGPPTNFYSEYPHFVTSTQDPFVTNCDGSVTPGGMWPPDYGWPNSVPGAR
jgi:RHS repeat-associated protein